jgi:hypothetical protein
MQRTTPASTSALFPPRCGAVQNKAIRLTSQHGCPEPVLANDRFASEHIGGKGLYRTSRRDVPSRRARESRGRLRLPASISSTTTTRFSSLLVLSRWCSRAITTYICTYVPFNLSVWWRFNRVECSCVSAGLVLLLTGADRLHLCRERKLTSLPPALHTALY